MKILILVFGFFGFFEGVTAQNTDSLVDKNKASIAMLKLKIENLENDVSVAPKSEVLEKEIIVYRDSITYLTKKLEVCAAEKNSVESTSAIVKSSENSYVYFGVDVYKLAKSNETVLNNFYNKLPSSYLFIIIKGHADQTGDDNMNEVISRKRANAIKEYLIAEKNIAPQKIMINWFGSSLPKGASIDEDRRCELSVLK